MQQPNFGDSKVFILNKEFLDRVHVGLGELPGKFSIAVVFELQRQAEMQANEPAAFLAELQAAVKPIQDRVPPAPHVPTQPEVPSEPSNAA